MTSSWRSAEVPFPIRLLAMLAHDCKQHVALAMAEAAAGRPVAATLERLWLRLELLARLGKPLEQVELLDARALVDRVVDGLRATTITRDVEVTCGGAADPIHGDPLLVPHAVECLVRNGLEACLRRRRAGLRVHVEVANTAGVPGVVIAVRDEGVGMHADELTEVLGGDAAPTSKRTTGAGLGILAVLTVARSHGGRLEVESWPGAGSTFRLTLGRW